jgi:S-DNA-T family DNA segregation ATPase FtsK/SpoIIIE
MEPTFYRTAKFMAKNKDTKTYKIAAQCIIVGLLALLLCSCISFDINDWPSKFTYPHNQPTANWCGPIGAFCAYYMLYYIGPGSFALLIFAIALLISKSFKQYIGQPILRGIGLALVTTAASASFYFFFPRAVFHFPTGSGGVLGIATVVFLKQHFALIGTFILLLATWITSLVLLADTFIVQFLKLAAILFGRTAYIAAPAWSAARQHSQVLGEIWQKLSEKQKTVAQTQSQIKIAPQPQPQTQPAEGERKTIPIFSSTAQKQQTLQTYIPPDYQDYTLPPIELLKEPERGFSAVQETIVKSKASALETLLAEFNISAQVIAAETGPVVTMFELELSAGIKVSQISNLANDMARALSAGAVRVVAPLPGKHTIGIEVPNSEKEKVRIKDIINLAHHKPQDMQIPLFLGKDSSGEALLSDLTSMPHLLIAGTTGSGKSVCLNAIIAGILLTKRPDEVKLILIDPKMVEMTAFNTVPHLMCPIVTETQRAVQILEWATVKMDERYALLSEARVKNIAEYNRLGPDQIIERFNPSTPEEEAKIPKQLPYIVIVIDELADLMMTSPKEIEAYIVRLAQKSRAIGIHIVLATQRPQATVVTGLIKSNMPCRIGFRVAARLDSRIVLDQNGAETLLGEGDMLFLKPGTSDLNRAQGTFVDTSEVRAIVRHLKEIAEPQFHPELTQLRQFDATDMEKDDLFDESVRVVLETKRGSVSLLQRRLNIGYARASRIIEMMAGIGILGEYKGSQAREVLMNIDEYELMLSQRQPESPDPSDDQAHHAYVAEGERSYASLDNE